MTKAEQRLQFADFDLLPAACVPQGPLPISPQKGMARVFPDYRISAP